MIKFNSINFNKTQQKGFRNVSFDKQLKEMVKKFTNRAEYEISDTNFYRVINEPVQNADKKLCCKSIALSVSADETEKAQHILEVSMLHPSMQVEIKRPLAIGKKEDILKYLNSNEFLPQLKQDISEMSEKLASK